MKGKGTTLTLSNSRLDFARGFLEDTSQEGIGTTTFEQEIKQQRQLLF